MAYFARIVKTAIDSIMTVYVVSILRGRDVFEEPEAVAQQMRRHKQVRSWGDPGLGLGIGIGGRQRAHFDPGC